MASTDDDSNARDEDDFSVFLRWCASNSIDVREDAVEFTFAMRGGSAAAGADKNRGVEAKRDLARGEIVATIPFEACLTLRACSRSDIAASVETRLAETKLEAGWLVGLTCALCVERNEPTSRWRAYDKVLPRRENNVVSLWGETERKLLVGTELEMTLRDELSAAKSEWERVVEPIFARHSLACSFEDYHDARTVVSSRAFTLSPNAGVGLVPIADAFNHRTGGHDVNVGDGSAATTTSGDALCVKVTKEDGVRRGQEIFNTYGMLGNANLLNSYGFAQEENPADKVHLTTTNIRAEAALAGISGGQIAKRFEWLESVGLCSSDGSFAIDKSRDNFREMCDVVWTCITVDELFNRVRHSNTRADAMDAIFSVSKSMNTRRENDVYSTLTPEVSDIVSRAIERRLSLYASLPHDSASGVGKTSEMEERLALAAQLIRAEREILSTTLDFLRSAHESGCTNKRPKGADDSAFALFD